MANTAERVYHLIHETVENLGVTLWDVRFVKEGASHYLRVYIDKPGGVTIDDCTDVSHAIDPVIDEADPIDVSYFLEVCSPGLERELSKPSHFRAFLGQKIKVKLYKALDGKKEWTGKLVAAEEGITLETEDGSVQFPFDAISKANLLDFES